MPLFIALFSTAGFAQSVTVTPRKVTYKRPKPFSEFKKTFIVTYPKIKASTPALSRKIETAVSYERVSDLNIKRELNEIQWLEEAGYEVKYNKNGILALDLTVDGSGAYPSSYSRPVVVNTKTGERVRPADIFTDLARLTANCKAAQTKEIKQALIDIKKESPEEENPGELFKETKFTLKNLDRFTISEKGVTFKFDYGFPHVIQALQPEGDFFFSWAELKPFIRKGGLLEQFVR